MVNRNEMSLLLPKILAIALVFTFVSGLYIVVPMVVDATIINFGFPFRWFEAIRGEFTWPYGPWHFTFLWYGFVFDFLIYGLLATIAVGIHEKKLKYVIKPNIQRTFFWISIVALVICLWFLIWGLVRILNFVLLPAIQGTGIPWTTWSLYGVQNFVRFLAGELTVVFTWSLIKYRKAISPQ